MPTPVLDNLTSESSTRDLLNALLAYHHARGPALAVARMALESAADALAKGTGVAERVVLTDPERDISIGAFFGGMDRAQAGRFLDELFVDMIPHLANQRSVMRDLHQGQTPSGMAVHSHDGAKRVAHALDQLSDEDLARVSSTHVRRLVWADDHQRTITANVEVDVSVASEDTSPRFGRGLTL